MRFPAAAAQVLRDYPRIYFACHRRHTRDPVGGDLVSLRHVQILDHLDEITALTLSDLADHLGVTPSTTSIAIDRLAKRGYVSRTPDVVDRRRVHLRLTAAGARVCAAHSVLDPARVDSMIAALSDSDRQRALDGLALLARAAVAASDGQHHDRPADQSHAV
jgi:MarR family transcriptional regulator, organic hydroperoxide resistance regulator